MLWSSPSPREIAGTQYSHCLPTPVSRCVSLAPPFPLILVSQSVTNPLTPRHHVQVRILCTGDGYPKPINVYVAHVCSSFLQKLDFLGLEPAADSGLDITHWHVPAEPFQTLSYRVYRALGLLDRSHGEMLAQDLCQPIAGSKRKRDHSDGCMPSPSGTCSPRMGAASPVVRPADGEAPAGPDS